MHSEVPHYLFRDHMYPNQDRRFAGQRCPIIGLLVKISLQERKQHQGRHVQKAIWDIFFEVKHL